MEAWQEIPEADFRESGLEILPIRRVLDHLPVLSRPDFVVGEWSRGGVFEYSREVQALWDALYPLNQAIDGILAGEGKGAIFGNRPPDLMAVVEQGRDPGRLSEAPLGAVLLYLRGVTGFERFSEGFFAEEYEHGGVVAALRRLDDLCQCQIQDIDRILAFLPIFESLTLQQFRHWNDWERMTLPEGGEALHMPYPEYHPAVWEWNEAVNSTPFCIDPYREVPGKKGGVPPPRFLRIGAKGRPSPKKFFAKADLDEVRQYMAVCLRGEKWCEGNIASEFERGALLASFHRLAELREEMADVLR